MIMVREVWIAKPGQASKMAKMFKEWEGAKVYTDYTGVFNKVVIETEYENLATYEKRMDEYMSGKNPMPNMAGYHDMFTQGKREIYRVW